MQQFVNKIWIEGNDKFEFCEMYHNGITYYVNNKPFWGTIEWAFSPRTNLSEGHPPKWLFAYRRICDFRSRPAVVLSWMVSAACR